VVASTAASAETGACFSEQGVGQSSFVQRHSMQMFKEGRSFSGNERFKLWFGFGDGTFEDYSSLCGADSNLDGRGLVTADLDDDGDLDIAIHNMQRERHLLYENTLGDAADPRFLKLRLVGTTTNPEAIGASVVIELEDGRRSTQTLLCGAGFVSCPAPELVFGLGESASARVSVRWPYGALEDFGELQAGARARLVEGKGVAETFEARSFRFPAARPAGLLVRIGDKLDSLTLAGPAGEPSTITPRAAAGGKLYLNLWATTCVPCVAELPDLVKLDEQDGASVVLLSLDPPDRRGAAATIAAKRGAGLPIYYLDDEGAAVEDVIDLARLPIPTTLVLDEAGVLIEVIRGKVEVD